MHIFLVTGTPGVGKTTLVSKIATHFGSIARVVGFITEEVRVHAGGGRAGFDVVGLGEFSSQRQPLARLTTSDPGSAAPQQPQVGRFSVDVQGFERAALPILDSVAGKSNPNDARWTLCVIDEIGKMELFSRSFVSKMTNLLCSDKDLPNTIFVVTVAQKGTGLIAQVKSHHPNNVFEITHHSRDSVRESIVTNISAALSGLQPAPMAAPSASLSTLGLSYTTTICIIPPRKLWEPIQHMRREHHSAFARWPPHINLVYPFISDKGEGFAAAFDALVPALASVPPFEMTLTGFDSFAARKNGCPVVFLHPKVTPPQGVNILYSKLRDLFPQCAKKSQIVPHLTVCDNVPTDKVPELLSAAPWQQVSFKVDHVVLMDREEGSNHASTPFRVRAIIPLGGGGGGVRLCGEGESLSSEMWGAEYAELRDQAK